MDQTIRPSGDSFKGIDYPYGRTHYDYVSDQLNYPTIGAEINGWQYDTYTLPSPVRTGSVSNVRVYVRCQSRPNADGQKCKTVINSGGGIYYGSENVLVGSVWNDYYTDYTTNPYTSTAWTWDDVDNLLAGVALMGMGPSASYAECAEVWVVVTSFLEAGGGEQIIGFM